MYKVINHFPLTLAKLDGCRQELINRDTLTDEVPRWLCGNDLQKLFADVTSLVVEYPGKSIPMPNADVCNASETSAQPRTKRKIYGTLLEMLW